MGKAGSVRNVFGFYEHMMRCGRHGGRNAADGLCLPYDLSRLLPEKKRIFTALALQRIINRIENDHKCKAVYRMHADRAGELTGEKVRNMLEDRGITVTSTAGKRFKCQRSSGTGSQVDKR